MIDIGQIMKDGSLYAGHHPVYAKRFLLCKDRDEPEAMTWGDANRLSDGLFALPTKSELSLLYSYRTKIGEFSEESWYHASSEFNSSYAWSQAFNNGYQLYYLKFYDRVRLVRTVTQEELEALVC